MKRSLQDINFWVKEINENKDLNIEIIKLENIRNNKFFLSILNNDTDKDVIYMEYLIRFKSGQIISLFRQVLLKEYSYTAIINCCHIMLIYQCLNYYFYSCVTNPSH